MNLFPKHAFYHFVQFNPAVNKVSAGLELLKLFLKNTIDVEAAWENAKIM